MLSIYTDNQLYNIIDGLDTSIVIGSQSSHKNVQFFQIVSPMHVVALQVLLSSCISGLVIMHHLLLLIACIMMLF